VWSSWAPPSGLLDSIQFQLFFLEARWPTMMKNVRSFISIHDEAVPTPLLPTISLLLRSMPALPAR
jgi:hypothetical protein